MRLRNVHYAPRSEDRLSPCGYDARVYVEAMTFFLRPRSTYQASYVTCPSCRHYLNLREGRVS